MRPLPTSHWDAWTALSSDGRKEVPGHRFMLRNQDDGGAINYQEEWCIWRKVMGPNVQMVHYRCLSSSLETSSTRESAKCS